MRYLLFAVLCLVLTGCSTDYASPTTGPEGSLLFTIDTSPEGQLRYSVSHRGRPLIQHGRLGLVIDGQDLGKDATVSLGERKQIRETFPVRGNYAGVDALVNTTVYHVTSGNWRYDVEVRLLNDGLGFRYRFPEGSGADAGAEWKLTSESTTFPLAADATVYAAEHYEAEWHSAPVAEFQDTAAVALPLLATTGADDYLLITESAALDYLAVSARKVDDHTFGLAFDRTTTYQKSMTARPGLTTPWRVVLFNEDLDGLVNNPTVLALANAADSTRYANTDYIRPGRAGWTWVSGGFLGQSVENMRRQIPALGELGWEYLIIDDGWEHWPDKWGEVKKLADFGAEHGVKLILWKPTADYQAAWQTKKFGPQDTIRGLLEPDYRRAFFQKAREAGVAGLKVDFVEEYNLERVNIVRAILTDAAREELIINFHGSSKPSGLERTYPNLIVQEAVRGLENIWHGPEDFYHINTILPFTRYVIGTGDYTPFIGRDGPAGTVAHQLATAVIYNAPLNALAVEPVVAPTLPQAELLKALPTVWDETVVLSPSKLDEVAVFAKRSGEDWWLAVANGRKERTVTVDPSEFLPSGSFTVQTAADQGNTDPAWEQGALVDQSTPLELPLGAGGGFVARLVPTATR